METRLIDCTVIIPAYHAESTITRCLESFELSGTHPHSIELIVVNDGSTDNTQTVAEAYLAGFENCRVISKPNGGVSSARNAGIREARGEYLYFCDSDDMIVRATLDHMIAIAKANACDAVVAQYQKHNYDGAIDEKLPKDQVLARDYIVEHLLKEYVKGLSLKTTCNKLYKRDIICKNGLQFDEKKAHGEDWTFNLRFFDVAESMYAINEVLYVYFVGNGQGGFAKYQKNFEYGILDSYNRSLELNDRYGFFAKDSVELKARARQFICFGIGFLELDNVSRKRKKEFLKNERTVEALNVLIKLKPGELPGWTRKNWFAMALLKRRLYKLLIWMHYLFKIKLIPN